MAQKKPDQKKLSALVSRIEAAENWRDRNYREKWTRWYKMWRNHVDQLKDSKGNRVADRSNISIPYAFTMLETVLPRLVVTLFAGRPYVTLKGIPYSLKEYRERPDQAIPPWEANAQKMQRLLDHQQNVSMDLQDEFHAGLKVAALYGTTVAYTGWRFRERTVIRKERMPVMLDEETELLEEDGSTPVMDWQPVEVSVKEYDDPEVKFLDLGLFYHDTNAEDIDDARFAGHVEYLSKEQLQELVDQGELVIDWKKVPKNSVRNEARNYRMNAIGIPMAGEEVSDPSGDMDLFEVNHYWEDDRYCIIINRAWLARDSDNPFWHKKKPYDKAVYTKVPNEFHGIGLMEVVDDLQQELNTERNQRIDYRSLSMRRMWKQKRDAEINPNDLVIRQNGIIRVDDMDDLQPISIADPAVSASFGQEDRTKADMRDATGAHDVVMGTSGSSETATTTMSKDNNASIRFKLIITSLEKRLLVAVSRKMIQLNQQFIDDIRLLPLFDDDHPDWPEVTPEDIQGEFHLIAAGSSVEPLANKEAHKQRLLQLYSLVSGDPIMQQYPAKRRNLLKMIFSAFGVEDTDNLLPTDEELAGELEQRVLAQMIEQLPAELQQLIMATMSGQALPAPAAPSAAGPLPADLDQPAVAMDAGMPAVAVGGAAG